MSDEWVAHTERALATLEHLKTAKRRDRLEVITDLYYIIDMLNRSVHGWQHWIRNFPFMAQFTEDELNAIKNRLINLTEHFLRYDLEASKQYPRRMLDEQDDEESEDEPDTPNEDAQGLYA